MPFKKPEYPNILTNANWQKNKGKIAKMAGETGIGDLMKKCWDTYQGINWRKFQLIEVAAGQGMNWTQQDIDDAYKEALKEGGKIKVLDDASRALERSALALAAEWKKDKLIPAASAKHVQLVSDEAKKFNYLITMGTISAALDKEKKETEDAQAILLAEWKKNYVRLLHAAKGFEAAVKNVTLETYQGIWSQQIRMIGTTLPMLAKDHPEFKAEYDIWKQFSNKLNIPADEAGLKKEMVILVKVSKLVADKLEKIL